MLDDLIIETESIDITNLSKNISDKEKIVIDVIEKTEIIKFDLRENYIDFCDKDGWSRNYWIFKKGRFKYSYHKIYRILEEKFGYKEQEINDLVKDILLNHYKIKVIIIHPSFWF